MKRFITLSLLAFLAGAPVGVALAEKADRQKPMNIESDALRHDELQQTSIFTGRVVLTKGTIILRGARLEMRQGADGYPSGTVTSEPGQRAFFRQKRDTPSGSPSEFVEGEAEVIEYQGQTDSVRLSRRAELRRYRGTTLSDEITGAVVVYNGLTDVFTVDSTKATPGARVRAVLAPTPTAPSPSAAPSASSPVLRSSTTLGASGADKP